MEHGHHLRTNMHTAEVAPPQQSPLPESFAYFPRCINITVHDAPLQTAKLLGSSWSLPWTERIIEDFPPPADHYRDRLMEMFHMFDQRFGLAFAVPDETFGCLRSITLETKEEREVVREFLLSVLRQVSALFGAPNPYELYLVYKPSPKPPPDMLVLLERDLPSKGYASCLPTAAQQYVDEKRLARAYFLQGSPDLIGKAYNNWRMEKNRDPLDYATVQSHVLDWIDRIIKSINRSPSSQRDVRQHQSPNNNKADAEMRVPPLSRHVEEPTGAPTPAAPFPEPTSSSPTKQQQEASSKPVSTHAQASQPSPTAFNHVAHQPVPPQGATQQQLADDRKRKRDAASSSHLDRALQMVVPHLCMEYARHSNVTLSYALTRHRDDELVRSILQWQQQWEFDEERRSHRALTIAKSFVEREVRMWRTRAEVLKKALFEKQNEPSLFALLLLSSDTLSSKRLLPYLESKWKCTSCDAFLGLAADKVVDGFAEWWQEDKGAQRLTAVMVEELQAHVFHFKSAIDFARCSVNQKPPLLFATGGYT